MINKHRTFLVNGGILLAVLSALGLTVGSALNDSGLRITDLNSSPAGTRSLHPNLDDALSHLVRAGIEGEPTPPSADLRRRSPDIENGMVRIVVESETLGRTAGLYPETVLLKRQIEDMGGVVEAMADNLVEARLSVGELLRLAESPGVRYVRPPLPSEPDTYISEGVSVVGANTWNNLSPYRMAGREVKVAILDAGFKGYETLLGSELPDSVTTRSFRPDGDIYANQVHGAACAEIVHDMAPDARLYLVNSSGEVTVRNAVDYLVAEGVNVISYSMGWFNAGAGDGSGPICEIVRRATNSGILWASSSGNYAEDHYEGTFVDSDADLSFNFSGVDEILSFNVPANTPVSAYLNWDDWGNWDGTSYSGSSQDYDLYLWYWTGSAWTEVDRSANWQTGSQWPVEAISGWYSQRDATWGVSIRKVNTSRNCKHELFIRGNRRSIEYNVPAGSLGIPSDAPSALSTGAVDWSNDSYHYYSSRGPTSDFRTKPDFCSPSGVSTESYGSENFYGTSASAPHLAGALAVLLSKFGFTADQAVTFMGARAVDLGDTGKDNLYGIGRINLK